MQVLKLATRLCSKTKKENRWAVCAHLYLKKGTCPISSWVCSQRSGGPDSGVWHLWGRSYIWLSRSRILCALSTVGVVPRCLWVGRLEASAPSMRSLVLGTGSRLVAHIHFWASVNKPSEWQHDVSPRKGAGPSGGGCRGCLSRNPRGKLAVYMESCSPEHGVRFARNS